MTPNLRVTLFPPFGGRLTFTDCVIESILLPDLSFRGVDASGKQRHYTGCTLAYLIEEVVA